MAKQSTTGSRINVWQMLRDVLIHSMNKGQLPTTIFGLILLVIAIRMPENKLGELASTICGWRNGLGILGWIIAALAFILWFIHIRYVRSVSTKEVDRLAQQRSEWQARALGQPMPSSAKEALANED